MTKFLLWTLLTASGTTHAQILIRPTVEAGGIHVGNGGDAVVCRDTAGNILSATVLDIFLSKRPVTLSINSSFTQTLDLVWRRLDRLTPVRAAIYRRHERVFWSETTFTSDNLSPIFDEDAFDELSEVPKGCFIEQLVVRVPAPGTTPGVRLTFQREIWNALDSINKATLLLHEIVYDEFVRRGGHTTSRYARRLCQLLISDDVEGYSYEDFIDFLRNEGHLTPSPSDRAPN